MADDSREFPTSPLDRPIRVVLFCGPALERGTVRFARLLEAHPDVEFLGGVCQTEGLDPRTRVASLFRRRGVLAPALLGVEVLRAGLRWLRGPRAETRARREAKRLMARLRLTPDLHSPEVLDPIRELEPDLAVSYGGPILKPEAFELPRYGTLGIHHGRFPDYRGKKATFWALLNDERVAGVTIQRIGSAIDAGPVVRSGEVPARGRSYRRVEKDLEELGLDLYLDAVLAVRDGTARSFGPPGEPGPLYRDPGPRHLTRYGMKRMREMVRRPRGAGPSTKGARPLGVLLLTESYHPMVGGGETQARGLASELSGAGLPVRVVTRRWDPERPALGRVDGIPVHRLGPAGQGHLRKWGLAWTARGPIREHRKTHPVLLVSGFRVLGIPAVAAGRRNGARVILKADSPGEFSGTFFGPGLARYGVSARALPVRALLGLRNRHLRKADAFVAISSVIEQELLAGGVPRERIHRIPNGVDTEAFRPALPGEREQLRTRLGLPVNATLVLYTGRLVSYKGLPLLLRVWADLAPRHPDAHLVLVGEGGADIHDCEAELRAMTSGGGAVPRVHLPGAVEHVGEYLRAADLFVFPSEEEAFGLSVIEAMASGLPVVSTRAGGLADVVAEENGALPVRTSDGAELSEALDRLLSDPTLRRELGDAGRRTAVARYDFRGVREAWLALIDPEEDRR